MSRTHYGLEIHDVDDHDYAVGTDEQATAACREYIRDSLWAFRPSFIASYTPEGVDEEVIKCLVEKKYEEANEALARLIGDRIGDFLDDAIRSDGRGHFLSGYDGEEIDSDDVDGLPTGLVAYRLS
jgi:hypothetical protein